MKDEIKTNPDCDFILRKDVIDLCTRFIEGESRGWVKRAIREVQTSLLGLPSSNLVNKTDVVREFIKLFGDIQDISDIEEWADVCETTVNEIPSIETIQGEWIKTVDGNGWNDWYVLKCPFCGATIEDKHYHSWEYNFCPHCGERVKGW